jgi:hypothetical protein
MCPGLSTLTLMSRPLRSTIQLRANARTAAFDALYTDKEGKPLIEAIEPVRITEEPLVNNGSAFCTVNSSPRRFGLNVLSKCSSVISSNVPKFVKPGIHRQHMDASGLALDDAEDAVEIGEVGSITPDRCGIAADRVDSLIQLGLAASCDEHSRAFFCETPGNAEADPRRCRPSRLQPCRRA